MNNESFLFKENNSKWKIRGDSILKVSRDYFNCQTLNGIPLEDGGNSSSAGSHFEKMIFADEMMTPDDTLETKLSKFSLAVALDSGFFEIDMSKAEKVFWGKNEGCKFLDQTCESSDSDEFCSLNKDVSCSDNLMYRTLCQNSQFTGNCLLNLQIESCKIKKPSNDVFATFGQNSLCLNTIV